MDVRKDMKVNNLIGTAWSWEYNDGDSGLSVGVYKKGEGHCEKSFAILRADSKKGKVTLCLDKDVLKKHGIRLVVRGGKEKKLTKKVSDGKD